MRFELIGVPYTSMAEPGGIARAIHVLRSAGLVDRLRSSGDVHDAGDLDLIAGDGTRGASGLLNEAALARLVLATREAVAAAHARRRVPLVMGGDCPVLLGALAAIRDRHGSCGLVLVDGHEDAWPPSVSPTGEASDSEVALALGLVSDSLPAVLEDLLPLLAPQALAMLGPRDRAEIEEAGGSSLEGTAAMFCDPQAVRKRGPAVAAREAAAAMERAGAPFWLHVDLDVLSTQELDAVDYPQPGGLTWPELEELATHVLAATGCMGASVVIYNPDRDTGGTGAARIVELGASLVAGRQGEGGRTSARPR